MGFSKNNDSADGLGADLSGNGEHKYLYDAHDLSGITYAEDLGHPGSFPFTRGVHTTGYGEKLWTMRQFSGFGMPEETNRRYHELLKAGGTGLSVAFDLPTLMGRDPDHALSIGEVGRCGVSVSNVADMRRLFNDISLDQITTSMTINSPAAMLMAMYLVVAEEQGADWAKLSGTIQNDILKEYIAQKEYIFPPCPSMRLVTDVVAFCSDHVPRWNTISVSGYHIREAGATAAQELAFTLSDGMEYVQHAVDSGLNVDHVAPRISFFFNAHNNFFEEIAKFRVARKLWATTMSNRFGAKDERSKKMRFHAQTSGVSLTAQQPYNNVVRTTLQSLAAVLGGANSLHVNALDEALALPTREAALLALRTQQILAHETGTPSVIDPFGGSYYLETLTSALEASARAYFEEIDRRGGMVASIEAGYPQREVANSAYQEQQAFERGDSPLVGVNEYIDGAPLAVPTLLIDDEVAAQQLEQIERVRKSRNETNVCRALESLGKAAKGTDNLMPLIIEAVRAEATLGEMCDTLRSVWGEYEESPVL